MATSEMILRRGAGKAGARLGLVGLVAAYGAASVALWRLTGPPGQVLSWPGWERIAQTLGGTQLPEGEAIAVAAGAAWLALLYLGLSTVLHAVMVLAASLTSRARWTVAGLRITAPLTIPLVRHVVDGALAGTIVLGAALQTPRAHAETAVTPPAIVQAPASPAHSAGLVIGEPRDPCAAPGLARLSLPESYTVVQGDSLWRISERFLGDGFRWTDLWALNQHREMPDGRTFVEPNLIFPGWILELPQDEAVGIAPPPEPSPATAEPEGDEAGVDAPTVEPSPSPTQPAPAAATVAPTLPTASPVPLGAAATGAGRQDGPAPREDLGGQFEPELPKPPLPSVATMAALSMGGVAMLLVFRRRKRSQGDEEHGERLPAGSGDAGRVAAVTAALQASLVELDFGATDVVLVRETSRYLEFTLDCPPGDADALVASCDNLGRQLACAADGEVLRPTSVRLKLSRLSRLASILFADSALSEPSIVPVGASDAGIFYLNIAACGTVLVSGSRLEIRDLLRSWVSTLASLHPSGGLAAVCDGAAKEHVGEPLSLLPAPGEWDAGDDSVASLARRLEERIVRGDVEPLEAEFLLTVIGPAQADGNAIAELDAVLRQGPEHGIITILSLDGSADPDLRQRFGAAVTFHDPADGREESVLTLTVPRQAALRLDRVLVRPQVASRPGGNVRPAVAAAPPSSNVTGLDAGPTPAAHASLSEITALETPQPMPSANGEASLALGEDDRSGGETPNDGSSSPAMDRQPSLPLDDGPDAVASTENGPLFRVRCFGSFGVEGPDGEVDGWSIQKARELLAFLVAHGGAPVPRERVAEELWPEGDPDQISHQLSNTAYYLRRALSRAAGDFDGQVLVAAHQRYHLRSGLFRVDVDAFDAHIARAEKLQGYEALVEYERALVICTGDFLSNEVYEWAEVYRREYQKRFIAAAHRAAKLAAECRDQKLAVGFYEAILERDRIDEEAVRGAMVCYSALGDTNAVKRAYRALMAALREELEDDGAEPLPETIRLLEDLTPTAAR